MSMLQVDCIFLNILRLHSHDAAAFLLLQVISDKAASPKNIPSVKHPNPNISPLKNKNNTVSPLSSKKPLKKEVKLSSECTTPSRLVKVPLTCKTRSGQKISWDVLPPTITELGKVYFPKSSQSLMLWTCGCFDVTFLISFAMLFLIIAASCSTSQYRLFSRCTFAWRSIGCRWCS